MRLGGQIPVIGPNAEYLAGSRIFGQLPDASPDFSSVILMIFVPSIKMYKKGAMSKGSNFRI